MILFFKKNFFVFALFVGGILIIFCSCGTTRPYTYMQGQFDTAALSKANISNPIIQKGDLMSIIVYSDNPEATKLYNQTLISTGSSPASGGGGSTEATIISGGGSTTAAGYLVDESGNIQFQGLGQLHVEGLTVDRLKALLDSNLKDTLLKNPYYSIRFLNSRFTMLGEVAHPGVFSIPSGHINLLEAFALSGDLTFYARRDNILVIRELNGKREFSRLDVTKPEVMSSPYFYLQQNDIVIIEQNKKKAIVNDQITTRNIGIAASLISTIAILYSLLRK
ncbi:MAG TPA: polysaccharide biosynthesis/export family protein [Puia sp.]|nr:polysaccharide biosynthesis/export family protein [Puia sp.]